MAVMAATSPASASRTTKPLALATAMVGKRGGIDGREHRDRVPQTVGESGPGRRRRERDLVHVQSAVDLDLESVNALGGDAVVAGGEAAGVGFVAPDHQAQLGEG